MANEVEICNASLGLLGEEANIVSIKKTDGTELSGLCARWYPMACRRLFEEFDWSFAQKRVKLSEMATVDPLIYGVTHAYAFPSDAVRIVRLYERRSAVNNVGRIPVEGFVGKDLLEVPDDEWRVEFSADNSNRIILTDVEEAVGHYTCYLSSPALYPQYFVEPLIILLASYLVGPVKRLSSASSESLSLLKQYGDALSRAKTVDSASTHHRPKRIPSSVSSRWV